MIIKSVTNPIVQQIQSQVYPNYAQLNFQIDTYGSIKKFNAKSIYKQIITSKQEIVTVS